MIEADTMPSMVRLVASKDRQAISPTLRTSFEDLIDRLITILDIADGDSDFEADADREFENEHAVDARPQRQRAVGRLVLV